PNSPTCASAASAVEPTTPGTSCFGTVACVAAYTAAPPARSSTSAVIANSIRRRQRFRGFSFVVTTDVPLGGIGVGALSTPNGPVVAPELPPGIGVMSVEVNGFIVVRSRKSLVDGFGCTNGRGAGRGNRSAVPASARPNVVAS